MSSKKLVIIDTDCGVDDAMAIMLATYCHKHNMIDIMAITCQFGNTYVDNVVKNVGYTLNASDIKGIKIYRGCEGPLDGKYVLEEYYGTDGLGDSTKDMPPIDVAIEGEPAANTLVRLAREHPKQITLIALGPLTNIASAYILDNKFFDNLKQIVLMSGSLDFNGNTYPVTSFNIISDVEACSIVLSNANCAVTVVPNECCKSNILTWDIYDQIVKLGSKRSMFMKQITDMEVKDIKENTDSGVDDALAIMLATFCHKHNMIDIIAITCQFGNTYVENVVKNVGYTLNASKLEEIKIYRGSDGPIVGKFVSDNYYGIDGLGNSTLDMPPIDVHIESEHAVNALVRLVREHPKQITLIALGPLTNIALAYMLDNKFFDNLNQIVFMGGTLDFDGNSDPVKSFNIDSDVEAISRVLLSANCAITVVPNECCKKHVLTWITDMEVKRMKEQPGSKGIVMFDILAVMAPIYEDYIELKAQYKTSVELNGGLTRGELVFDKRSTPDVLKNDWKSVQYIKHFNDTKLSQLMIDFMK
ncbi:unnamed protein product [Medioppia subpectinata]|uniref:Inosine/uridine-preferring nucleoside hydrolase domain-containing protein n=1 Tax=Medioppia subpectinata TaxID=1979941 RepID=A0A7R9PY80_9ACAR|nr:unnamed protein product [Medioppia subpectinata]CAG2105615.1 unnamed protein product [Medioppia subpectinata]